MAQEQSEFWTLAKSLGPCMMTTIDNGALHSRPMAPIVDDSAGEIRFLTRASSHKADEVEQDRHVNLAFVGPDRAYVSVEGTARMSQDRDLIKRCWSDAAQAWLPEGPDGADVALIRVEPRRADVWDLTSNAIDRSFEIKAAARDGRVPDVGSQKTVRP